MPFKMNKIIFFQKKIIKKNNMCAYPTLNFRTVTRNTLIFFLFGLTICKSGIQITLCFLFKEHYDVRTAKHLILAESNFVI